MSDIRRRYTTDTDIFCAVIVSSQRTFLHPEAKYFGLEPFEAPLSGPLTKGFEELVVGGEGDEGHGLPPGVYDAKGDDATVVRG